MASKSVYQEYNTDALKYFGLDNDTCYGVVVGSEIKDVLVTQDETTYDKIRDILCTPTCSEQDFKTKKKAWIMPGCTVSQDRLKPALKEHGIIVTNDYELADLVVGEEGEHNVTRNCDNAEHIPNTALMGKLWNYETTSGPGDMCNGTRISRLLKESGRDDIIITTKVTESIRASSLEIEDSLYDTWFITGLAMNIAHHIKDGQFEIVDAEDVLHASASQMVLDNSLLDQLKNMMGSSSEDQALAVSIIPNIDYNSNHHLLWQLSQDCNNINYADPRNKNLKYWLGKSRFDYFQRKCAQDMILWLEQHELLNKEGFRHLEPIVRRDISITNRDLYVFKVAVKKEYQQYLKKEK